MKNKQPLTPPITTNDINPQKPTEKSETLRIAEAQLKVQLMLKKSIEFNASILTIVAQAVNANSNEKPLKEDRLIKSIKQINKDYMSSIEEIARG